MSKAAIGASATNLTAKPPKPNGVAEAAKIQADGHADVKGSDWGFGYQLAWMWDINDRARVGVNYRSKVSHTLKPKPRSRPTSTAHTKSTTI